MQAPVVRVGSVATAARSHHIVLRRIPSRPNASVPKSIIEFDGTQNSALLDSIGTAGTSGAIGLIEPLDANGRPITVPANGSGNYTDHHAITVINGANKILIRNNEASGHNGDSLQCGEESSRTGAATSNLTIENNRFHADQGERHRPQGLSRRHHTQQQNLRDIHRLVPTTATELSEPVRSRRRPHLQSRRRIRPFRRPAIDRTQPALGQQSSRQHQRQRQHGRDSANLVFNASTASCGIGAGFVIAAKTTEVYHNTLDDRLGPQPTVGCGNPWSSSEKYALRVNPNSGTGARQVIWNNIISNATNPYTQTGSSFTLDASRNLFQQSFTGMPPGSIIGDPRYVADPTNNDDDTRQGSP